MSKIFLILVGATLVVGLGACNTVSGVGRDVSAVGQDISSGAHAVGQEMRNN
ncbi:MAG: entericidin A/B family lipoprotein [Chthoniobacterales bacterium]|jgi:predicted small secreted protein